jgi:hypothetical protein
MPNNWQLEQNITVILAESNRPMLHTLQIAKRLGMYHGRSEGKDYRAVLRALHRMEKSGKVYWWNSPRDGSCWMLKMRDVKHAYPVSYRSIVLGELPF